MPRPSNETLMRRLGLCTHRLGVLSTDEDWNITTRKALPFALEDGAESARHVVLVRFHAASLEKINGAIRRAVNVRAPEAYIRARWNSHEAIFILSELPHDFSEKLKISLRNEGVSNSIAYVPYSGSIQYDHDRATSALFPVLVEE